MPGYSQTSYSHPVLLTSTNPISFSRGVAGIAGTALDTLIYGFQIGANATAVTLTLTGFIDSMGAAASIVWTGSTSGDTVQQFQAPLLNEFAALTATASVASKVRLYVGAYDAAGTG